MQTREQKMMKDSEISLSEIYQILSENWRWIVLSIVLGTGLGALLAFLLPKKFEAAIYLEPPLAAQYMDVNEGRTPLSGLNWISGNDLYNYFLNQLKSDAAKHEFFEKTYLPSLQKQPQNDVEKNALYASAIGKVIAIKEPLPNKGRQLYSVQMWAPSRELAARWTRDFLDQVENAARSRWVEDEKN